MHFVCLAIPACNFAKSSRNGVVGFKQSCPVISAYFRRISDGVCAAVRVFFKCRIKLTCLCAATIATNRLRCWSWMVAITSLCQQQQRRRPPHHCVVMCRYVTAAAALIVVIGDNELRQHIRRHRFHINHAAIALNTAGQTAAVFSLCTS